MIQNSKSGQLKPWHLALAIIAVVAITLAITAMFAGKQASADKATQAVSQVDNAPLAGPPPGQGAASGAQCKDAYLSLVPEAGAPGNGGTAHVGDHFTLDLIAHHGTGDVAAQQSYMGFSYDTLQVVDADNSAAGPASKVNSDLTKFDTELQNEVCNGPGACTLRGQQVDAGSIAYASGSLSTCPSGCTADTRVARIAFRATKPGDGAIHWQFTAPTRQTMLVSNASQQLNFPSCYTDYKITIAGK